MICQKPLAPDIATARKICAVAETSQVPFVVHENFRFQPWYREIRRLLDAGTIGHRLHTITMRTRTGDGWGTDAYLNRQPYFRTMPHLLIHENRRPFYRHVSVSGWRHRRVFGDIRRLNNVIIGEDTGTLSFRFSSGARAVWDANRCNESLSENFRYTFGELLVEASGGSLWLNCDGTLTIKLLGQPAYRHDYVTPHTGFGGDCVLAMQQHFLDILDGRVNCETSASEYLQTLNVVEALRILEKESPRRVVTKLGSAQASYRPEPSRNQRHAQRGCSALQIAELRWMECFDAVIVFTCRDPHGCTATFPGGR